MRSLLLPAVLGLGTIALLLGGPSASRAGPYGACYCGWSYPGGVVYYAPGATVTRSYYSAPETASPSSTVTRSYYFAPGNSEPTATDLGTSDFTPSPVLPLSSQGSEDSFLRFGRYPH